MTVGPGLGTAVKEELAMAKFTVNGRAVTVENNQKLLRYLRDTLHLTSVKDGCSEGACGTCTVLIDGKPTKACIPQTDKLEGKSIVTVEGLTDFEKQVYTYAFGMAGGCSARARCRRLPLIGPWGSGCPGWTWRRRSPAPASIPTTSIWTA